MGARGRTAVHGNDIAWRCQAVSGEQTRCLLSFTYRGQSMLLSELFKKYSERTDKVTRHSYGPLYDHWVGPMAVTAEHNILLIGVNMFGGGDIDAFGEYFQHSRIYCIDRSFDRIVTMMPYRKIQYNAYEEKLADRLRLVGFDLIVDDCMHEEEAQVRAFQIYYPTLRVNGRYVIEDVPTGNFTCVERVYRHAMAVGCRHFAYYGGRTTDDIDAAVVVVK